jgi:WhiB family redox-sensing transcriptional regulator
MQFSARAACAGTDPDCFFPESGGQWDLVIARRICAGCPIKVECLNWALKNREAYGIWGGTTYKQRLRMWVEQDRQKVKEL